MEKMIIITGIALAIVLSGNIVIAYKMFMQPLDIDDQYTMQDVNVVVAE